MGDTGVGLELFTWGPAWNVPSFDPFCLSIETYLQFAEANWVVNECNDTGVSPTGELPMLRDGPLEPVVGTSKIISHLKKKGLDLDSHLTAKEQAECLAYTSLIEDKLYDALLYSWWLEVNNAAKSTKPAIAKSLRGWAGMRVPGQLQRKAEARLRKYRDSQQVYSVARECYQALSHKLGEKEYFFGKDPSSLDAIAFGHLALHAIPALAEPTLFSILTFEFPTLYAYCERVRKTCFKKPLRPSPNLRPSYLLTDIIKSPTTYIRSLFMRRQVVPAEKAKQEDHIKTALSVLGAVGFFVGYIWYHGIIQISYDDDEEVEEGDDHNGVDDDDE
ncbi:uncharacterized protein SPPG_07468 [Spizellomyces punctatus DAOM BR117]|uniref:GST C-terminal domain-containing protein n=1 Tax=Spizellomyces punctatus (strain DAOM BR117) TaxID=645134 RepID=A0A0L0H790_SPIPD|nr:uncharacterized protein SPPG_07468 [Spizellomyces punctatus DAOM BR117]KNC97072.1 hypothetical protein SPPG_07468 [Spizellomyces punctatus DAOM BR117]|eukprot:XP_016605112.1 hypothetical protein SPPG_07468 [Spizellomyces punctatus DAOM BR117]